MDAQAKSRAWWLRGIEARCRQHPSLEGRSALVKDSVERRFRELLQKHEHRVTDSRSQTHLQVACLVVATYNTLQPLLRDKQAISKILREAQGLSAAPWLRWPLRFGLLLSGDPFTATARRLRLLGLDMGRGFACSFSEEPGQAELQIKRCLYHAMFESEGLSLTECSCCSQDSVWFEGLEWHGVAFERTAWLGAGDPCCKLVVRRVLTTNSKA
ncbi:hypothetical protein WJX81_008096 [Elliptochloris bilobata]|uniref:L-2-amino-thiazoline-4-carboxylic acid hydrolase n=1 Tax=Elliptochloris bilobata TaxID=381761 RepID=A0AAW1R3U8_9CHLO